MFKNVLIVLLGTMLTISIAAAEPKNENIPLPSEPTWSLLPSFINCTDINSLEEVIAKYQEIPFTLGQGMILIPSSPGRFSGELRTYVNPDTGSFTVVLMLGPATGCIVVMGKDFSPWMQNKTSL
tara:strand:+ start:955 stop:1329 length:375 start_codon:yes stop_codon:yes gene_type:complete